ncbi:MAG: polysaccharide deacetylase family protein [Candidatus Harrisonbacteria bacterium]|nr:polysaccharide deacetylase family protein [Candidatus Harrisonbacteria bacterium]
MYHSVSDSRAFLAVNPQEFEKQLNYLKQKKFTVIRLSELINSLRAGTLPKRAICLSFDDGYEDNLENVLPLLQKFNMPASIFVATGLIGSRYTSSDGFEFSMMSAQQLKTMQESGLVEFFPHSHRHENLDELPPEEGRKEIIRSEEELESLLGPLPEKIFSYPRGRFSAEIIEYLRESGWKGAVTVKSGLVRAKSDPFRLRRNSVDGKTSFSQFKAHISGIMRVYEIF